MALHTDHSFHIGEQHLRQGKPCQDYAHSGMLNETMAYAIVSDGCSSGGMTDIGSRLMVLATKQALMEYESPYPIDASLVNASRDAYLASYRAALGLKTHDLLATCLWAVASKDWVLVNVIGDGVVVASHEYDHMVHRFEWHKNMPYYPAYGLDGTDMQFVQSMSDNPEPFTHLEEGLAPVGMGGCRDGYLTSLPVSEGMKGVSLLYERGSSDVWPGKMLSIGLFTDGVEQIDGIPYDQAIERLMTFKSVSGQFVTRRMNRFLSEAKETGRGPSDDIALATIHFGNEVDSTIGGSHDSDPKSNDS